MYILDHDQQEALLRQLVLIEHRDGGWSATYNDPSTKKTWILFRHHGESHGGGMRVLREEPPPKLLSDWLTMCFSSGNSDDVRGLAWELSGGYDQWEGILDWLEARPVVISPGHLKLFIDNLEILPPRNRRSVVGKTIQEIDKDYDFFKGLSKRAKLLSETA